MSHRMFSRSVYQLQKLSRSSGFSLHNSSSSLKNAVFAAFGPLVHNRHYASENTTQPVSSASASSLNQTELAKFAAIADSW